MKSFGEIVRTSREALGLGPAELAQVLRLSAAELSGLERGSRVPSDDALLLALAQTLDVDPDRLFAQAGRLPPDLRLAVASSPLPFRRLRSDLSCPQPGWLERISELWIEHGNTSGVMRYLALSQVDVAAQLIANLRRRHGLELFPRTVQRSDGLDRAARELRESGEMPPWVWEVVENVKRQIAEEEAQQAAGG